MANTIKEQMGAKEGEDRKTRDLRILYTIAEALNSAPDVRQALQQTLALVTNFLGLQTGWVRLTADELQLLCTIANQLGIAIERARLAEESRQLARAEERTRIVSLLTTWPGAVSVPKATYAPERTVSVTSPSTFWKS